MIDKLRLGLIALPFGFGLGIWLFGALDDGFGDDDFRSAGVLIVLLCGMAYVARRAVVAEKIVERARLSSWDDGFEAGATANSHCTTAPLVLLRPSQELGEQHDVGRVADRIN